MAPAATARCFSLLFPFLLLLGLSRAANFQNANNCPYTVWAAASPGGGQQLDPGQSWGIDVAPGTTGGRVWACTGCSFDGSGRGSCQSGDCGGILKCQGYGQAPNTLAEYSLNRSNNLDFIDISNVDSFNVPMDFSPTGGCSRGVRCAADIVGQCPDALRVPGGCNGPCPVFGTPEYCRTAGPCGPTDYSRFFKDRCPDAYSYPKDDQTSIFTCPAGTNYQVSFCPAGEDSSGRPNSDDTNAIVLDENPFTISSIRIVFTDHV